MATPVVIAGSAEHVGRNVAIDAAVTQCVRSALSAAGLSLGEIDAVVTTGSDILDGGMVGTRSGIAGVYGRELIAVPSSGGHACAAAVSLIKSGQARNVLVAGWGEGTKFSAIDGRSVQADPFYARPIGADAVAMTALQAQRLLAHGAVTRETLDGYGATMRRRAGRASDESDGMRQWLRPLWADGACAIVLRASERGVRVADIGMSFRGYCPEPGDLDPAAWVSAAMANLKHPAHDRLSVIEACGPAAVTEFAALREILTCSRWRSDDDRVNASGGGAAAFFGPATGLRHIARAAQALSGGRNTALAIDLAGPIGQATSVIVLEGTN
jgi:acetyl-CoA acetyltransferase